MRKRPCLSAYSIGFHFQKSCVSDCICAYLKKGVIFDWDCLAKVDSLITRDCSPDQAAARVLVRRLSAARHGGRTLDRSAPIREKDMNEANKRINLRHSAPAQATDVTAAAERIRRRRIGLHHMAFIRGVYEGLDVGALAEQYLGNLGDRRRARSTLRWLVDELANAARKRGDSAGARLLRLPTSTLIDTQRVSGSAKVSSPHLVSVDVLKTARTVTPGSAPPAHQESHVSASATTGRSAQQTPSRAPLEDQPLPTGIAAERETLDAFREAHDPEGVYSEAELIALYEEAHDARYVDVPAQPMQAPSNVFPAAPGSGDVASTSAPSARPNEGEHPRLVARTARLRARNQRLRTRRREVLDRLEATLVEPPRLHHYVGDWIDPALAQRLEAIDIRTVGDLLSLINRRGFHWYRDVPRVGLRAAQRLQEWLVMNAIDLGAQIARHAAIPRRQWSAPLTAARRVTSEHIAAIEYFTPQDQRVAADRDRVLQVLERYKQVASTYRCFRLQAERLLLWTALCRQSTLGDLSDDDVRDYFAFMQAPDPEWCGPKVERGLPAWRPFEGPASAASLGIARRALKALFAQLVLDGVLSRNPFEARIVPLRRASPSVERKAQALLALPPLGVPPKGGRLPLPIHLARMRLLALVVEVGGMRISEASTLRVDRAEAMWRERKELAAEADRALRRPLTESQRRRLRAALADYLALRKAQMGAVDPTAPLFIRHTANGIDEAAKVPFVPAGTLVRVLSRYHALCDRGAGTNTVTR